MNERESKIWIPFKGLTLLKNADTETSSDSFFFLNFLHNDSVRGKGLWPDR